MNVLSLFAGIGGLELGLERAGMTTVGQVEIDPWCRQVLARHWPHVPQHDDVRTAPDWWASTERPHVDVVCGGFPCQPFSTAGRRRGVGDVRWGWPWFEAVVGAVRPRYVIVENVAALLRDADAWGWMLGDLASLGFDASWDCVPAASIGAPHLRDRVFLVAYAPGCGEPDESPGDHVESFGAITRTGVGVDRGHRPAGVARSGRGPRVLAPALADTDGVRRNRRTGLAGSIGWPEPADCGRWAVEPDLARMAYGIPGGVDRRRSLGNAVVPQVAEHIGRLIVDAEARAAA